MNCDESPGTVVGRLGLVLKSASRGHCGTAGEELGLVLNSRLGAARLWDSGYRRDYCGAMGIGCGPAMRIFSCGLSGALGHSVAVRTLRNFSFIVTWNKLFACSKYKLKLVPRALVNRR